jgi:biopolymer transport protein ExbD
MTRHLLALISLITFANCINKAGAQHPSDTSTLLIVTDSIYAWEGTNMKDYKKLSFADSSAHMYIASLTSSINPDKLIILIKPSQASTYKNTVDVLDEMVINKIKRYAIEKLTTEEQNFFQIKSFSGQPSRIMYETVEVKPNLTIILKPDGKLAYQYTDTKVIHKEIYIDPPTSKNIYDQLNYIEKQYSIDLHKIQILVKAYNDVPYKDFEKVMTGLKQKDIYKYELVTIE